MYNFPCARSVTFPKYPHTDAESQPVCVCVCNDTVVSLVCVLPHIWSTASRWWWTPWCLCAGSCVPCPARLPRGSARLCPPSLNKCPSLARPSAAPWWREQLKTLTERWSKKKRSNGRTWERSATTFTFPPSVFREVKLSVVSYLTNSIVDQILQELYTTHKTLVLVISLYCMLSL